MPSPYSDDNGLYPLTIGEAIQKIRIYVRGHDHSSEHLFEAEDQMPYNCKCHLLLAIGEESKK